MASVILNAIKHGFTSRQVLNHIANRFPKYATAINTAQAAGYASDKILKKLAQPHESSDDSEEYLTEHEKTQKRDAQQKKKAALQVAGTLGTAGAIGAGAYGYATRNRAIRGQVLPPLPGQGPTNSPRSGLPGGPRPGLPPPRGAAANQQAQQPSPQTPPQQPKKSGRQSPSEEGDLLPDVPEIRNVQKKGAEVNQLWDLAQKGKTSGNPFLKTANKLIKSGALQDVINFSNFHNWWNATEGQSRSHPMVEFEKFRVQTKGMFEPPTESAQLDEQRIQDLNPQQEQQHPEDMQQAGMEEQELAPQSIQQPQSITERTQQAAFAEKPELKRLVDTAFKGKEFAIPTYQFPGESAQDFGNRKIINEAIKKAANQLKEGKSFLDLGKISPEVLGVGGMSTAEDVLRFMAGIPNVYDPLLDETEKQELYDSLMETGQATIEGLRPSEGERGIHGAMMTPNMVWNLLLTVEPRLYKMERPRAIKGATKPGEKMDSTGFRRYLTHSVYGVLSGKSIGPDLSDKIARISRAASSVDAIVKAAKEGNFNKVLKEIENLSDDEIVARMFSEEVDNLIAEYGIKSMKPVKGSSSDTRSATEIRKKFSGNLSRLKDDNGD